MERFKGITIILLLAFAMLASAVQTKPASVLLQEGLYAEEIEGNLEAAIQVYERILKHFPKDRPVAAKALLHIGLSYEKLGRGEARKAYERVLREYADQPEAVSAARVRLTTLGQQEADQGPVVRQVWADAADPKFTGAPSPDGKYLSYVDWETGDLAIHELATGNNRRLTSEGWEKGWAQHSVFSPDSKYVACRWRTPYHWSRQGRAAFDQTPRGDYHPQTNRLVGRREAHSRAWRSDVGRLGRSL
jgi:tetratricopeptide (TPR) repeat protein